MQTWTVPANISGDITVIAKGASGGGNRGGGNGGTIQSVLSVMPGQVLNIFVGQAGSASPGISAYNGGGAGGVATGSYNNAGGGGGATDIRIGGTALSNRVLVAGGGGGSGGFAGAGGGAGGGTTGANGGNGQGAGGTGGSQSAGGTGGAGNGDPAGSNGTLGAGGAGGAPSSNAAGGGGGGGYYGGGGGGADYDYCCTDGGGGAGGSSYTSGSVISNVQGDNYGDGQLSISYTTLVCTGSGKTFDITVNPKYAITASAGTNGTISPSGTTNVCSGTSQAYSITASTAGSGYHIDDIVVDGSSLTGSAATAAGVGTGSGSYTFSNVTTTHTISASFAPNCIPPVISCNNTAITQSTDAGLCTAVVNYTAATATGTSPTISYSQNSGIAFSKGLTTVTATATNGCGTSQCSFTVTVNDNEAPAITCPANISVNTSANTITLASYPLITSLSDAMSNYGPVILSGNTVAPTTPSNGTPLCQNGVYINNPNGQSIQTPQISGLNTAKFTLRIDFRLSGFPAFSAPVIMGGSGYRWIGIYVDASHHAGIKYNNSFTTFSSTSLNLNQWYSAELSYSNNTATLKIDGNVVLSSNIGALTTGGNLNFTTTDFSSGAALNGCIRNLQILNGQDACGTLVTYTAPVGTDNCTGAVTTQTAGLASGANYPVGVTTNTFSVTDGASNTTNCSFSVTVVDNQPPVLYCPSNQSVNVVANTCAGNYTIADPIGDNCTGSTWGYSSTGVTTLTSSGNTIADGTGSGALSFTKGVTTVTLSGVDASTNAATSCSFTVTVNDNQAPVAAAQNLTVSLDANGNATVTPAQINNGSFDNCGSVTLTSVVPSSFSCSDVTGVSSAGNAASFSGGYIAVPDDASLNPVNTWTLETWFRTTASSTQQGLIEKYDNGSMYGYLLRITAGNKLMAGVVTAGTASGGTYLTGNTTIATNTWYHVAATYNRSGQIKLYVNGQADGSVSSTSGGSIPNNASTTTLKIGARGNDAGARMQGQMDEVRFWNTERTQSEIQSTKDKSLSGTETGLQAYYRFEEATSSTTATDNTPLTAANTGTISGSVTRVTTNPAPVGGTIPVTLTVTDGNNNTATATAFVTVKDVTAPTVVAKNITAYLDATGHVSITAAQVDNGSSDNCSGMTLSVTPSSFSCSKIGNTAGTLNGSLTADNSFTAYISSSDNTLGTQIGTGSNFSTVYSLSATTLTPGQDYYLHIVANDWGGPQSLVGDFTVSGNFEFSNGSQSLSTNTTNWNVNATGFGNTYNTPISYGVNGAGPWGTRSGISNGALNIWDPSGNNNDPVTSASSPTEIVYFSTPIIYNGNVHTVTLTATDASNNSSAATAQVTVLDNLNPSITAPSNVTVSGYCPNANAPASAVTLGNPTTSDNCMVASVTNNAPSSYPVGTTTVTWTATDASGNMSTSPQTVTITGPAVALGASAVAAPLYPMPGQKMATIFLNYPLSKQTDTMKVNAMGGTAPYAYSWTMSGCNTTTAGSPFSTGNTPYYIFNPSSLTGSGICAGSGADNIYTFNVKVTDNNGCTTSIAPKRLNVVNPYSGTNVMVCHKVIVGRGYAYQVVTVNQSTAANYVAQGDQLGNCNPFTGRTSAPGSVAGEEPVGAAAVWVYPNPSTGAFSVALSAIENEAVVIVTDVQGKLIARQTIAKDAPQAKASFDLSNVARGVYLVQVQDGNLNYRTKIVVQ